MWILWRTGYKVSSWEVAVVFFSFFLCLSVVPEVAVEQADPFRRLSVT